MIVIPMAGASSRFTDAGYKLPKYMLEIAGVPIFDHAVASFRESFSTTPFLFICRDIAETSEFVRARLSALSVRFVSIVTLDNPTGGQADTVAEGLTRAQISLDTDITIFNVDTFRPGYTRPPIADRQDCDGYLEVFIGSGDNWSFIRPAQDESPWVAETAEKTPISNLCCTGLYQFRRADAFLEALAQAPNDPKLLGPNRETYVAPLYNHLIRKGRHIGYHVIDRDKVVFCGVPAEYEALKQPTRF